jgi:predicted nucleic acid-binding protein
MRVYLDTCSLQRPLDSKIQIRIILEAESVLGILTLCERGLLDLVASDALMFEVERNPNLARQEYALEALAQASAFVELDEQVEKRARELHQQGIKPLDALHLACAERASADYFCTCDDELLRKARRLQDLQVQVTSPLELIAEVE